MEEPLPAGGSCLLGSLNLAEFVINPFTKDAKVDFDDLQKATKDEKYRAVLYAEFHL